VLIDERTEPDAGIVQHVREFSEDLSKKLAMPCGYTDVDLECRFEFLRSRETNIANFCCDLVRTEFNDCDLVMLNTGCLRSNALVPKGPLTLRFCADLIPGSDHVVLYELPGLIVLEMLENAVSMYPKLDGRFPSISGFRLAFDPN
jgi:5'-nucleotidase